MVGAILAEANGRRERIALATEISHDSDSEKRVPLLVESVRAFAGSLSQAPVWCFSLDNEESLSETTIDRLRASNATLIGFETDVEVPRFPFMRKAFVSAQAEARAQVKADLLVWLDNDTIVLREPKELLLQYDKDLGYRPVHIANIGSHYDSALDPFWTHIFRHCKVSESRIFPMTTHVEGTRIRPYFNAGLLVVRPEKHLLRNWRRNFLDTYDAPEFEEFYKKDERYAIFMHQAVLAGTILSLLRTDETVELPPTYNYPLHLYQEDATTHRPSCLEDLVTFRYEDTFERPGWRESIPAGEPLKRWLTERQ